jgi:hypothetical protein
MASLIQPLESRVLFSSIATFVSDGAQLVTDVGAARADAVQYAKALAGDVRTITADVRQVPASTGKQSLLRTLRADEVKWAGTVRTDVRSIATVATANGQHTISDAIRVFRHPTNLTFIAKLAADVIAIGTGLDAPLSKLQADVAAGRTALLADLNNIAAANPTDATLQKHVQQIGTDSQSAIDKLTADGQTLQGDLETLATTLGG